MRYTLTTWVFICDGCKAKEKVAGDECKLPEGWSMGDKFTGLRSYDYNQYIVNLHKDFCPKCCKRFELMEVFQ